MAGAVEVKFASEPTGPVAPAPEAPSRPEGVPEKFWNAEKGEVNTEALLKSYAALEGRLGAPKDETSEQPEQTPAGDAEKPEEGGDAEANAAAAEAGVNVADLEAHYAEHGSIPEDAYARFEAVGISKEMVDEYVQFRTSRAEALQAEMTANYGGVERVQTMIGWAGENWTEDKATAFNEAMGSKDRAKIDLALQSLEAAYQKANPKRPMLLKPQAAPSGGVNSFRSVAEMKAAMSDPRYRTDPAYRADVARRVQGMA